ncbi:MAG: FAD-dependent oxidoreductase, partial [Alcanivorax sp.]|nr:FAD-dependent oxidoreductase [Alcanivorax sp.]
MDKREVDVAVIGAGTAGMVAYQRARRATDRIVLIEGDQYGTTCARVGCMPSKLLIAAAERAHQVRQADAFGVLPGDVRIDGPAVMARVREERDRFVAPVVRSMESLPQEHRLMGHARFVDS